MVLTKDQEMEFVYAVSLVIQWLNKNRNPHTYVVITNLSAEIVSGEYMYRTEDYLVD